MIKKKKGKKGLANQPVLYQLQLAALVTSSVSLRRTSFIQDRPSAALSSPGQIDTDGDCAQQILAPSSEQHYPSLPPPVEGLVVVVMVVVEVV